MKRSIIRQTISGVPLALAALAVFACAPVLAQTDCQIARAELSAYDRSGGRNGDLDRWIAYHRSTGCDANAPLFARPPNCRQIEAQIARLQSSGAGDRGRAALAARVSTVCNSAAGALSASSRGLAPDQRSSSRVVIDDQDQFTPADDAPPESTPLGLGKAMCVRTCDGFYFPLQSSPGGREGADEMCQALCPASPTRAFFIDGGGSIDSATDAQGARYASLPRAYQFKRAVSATCGCRKPGETWSTTLQRAQELNGPQQGEMVVGPDGVAPQEKVDLRPSTGVAPKPRRRPQPIDPEPREDIELTPDDLPPEPPAIATMTPRAAPKIIEEPTPAPPRPRGPVRTVGPEFKIEKDMPRANK